MGGHNPALAVNQGDFRAFDLTRTALAAQLVHRLGDREQRAWMPGVAMGHEAAVGVDRQLPTEFDATAFHKPASLALGTEAQVLQLDGTAIEERTSESCQDLTLSGIGSRTALP